MPCHICVWMERDVYWAEVTVNTFYNSYIVVSATYWSTDQPIQQQINQSHTTNKSQEHVLQHNSIHSGPAK